MRKTILALLAMSLVPACSFAADGQVLINQSTVMAAGGFPYIISNPGSYKLSGNLTMSTSVAGSYAGLDIALGINSSGVVLDLNGFSITVNNTLPVSSGTSTINHNFYAIAELGTFTQVSIKNGTITLQSATLVSPMGYGVFLSSTTYISVEELSVYANFNNGRSVVLGQESLLRHNRLLGAVGMACPSLLVENVGGGNLAVYTSPCVTVNNAP